MSTKYPLLLILLLLSGIAIAQDAVEVVSDRPGQSISPLTVGLGHLQVQEGLQYNNFDGEGLNTQDMVMVNEVRLGIGERVEIGGMFSLAQITREPEGLPSTTDMNYRGAFRVRTNLYESDNYWPSLGFQTAFNFPIAAEGASTIDNISPQMTLATDQSLADWLSFYTTSGLTFGRQQDAPDYFYTVAFGFSVTDKLGYFVEQYAATQQANPVHNWNTGFSYMLKSNIQLDLYGGLDLEDDHNGYFISAGFSWKSNKLFGKR